MLDVDGVLTDGRLYLGPDGPEWKAFHVHDGLALARAGRAGLASPSCRAGNRRPWPSAAGRWE